MRETFKMLNLRIRICIIISLPIILLSCNEYDDIPDNMRFKFQEGDTLIFKCNCMEYDTFVVNHINYWYNVTDKQYYSERGEIYYKYIGKDPNDSLLFKNNYIEISTYSLYLSWGDFKYRKRFSDLPEDTINNVEFGSAYDLQIDSTKYIETDIYRIHYHGNYGVLKYWFRNGKEFELWKHLQNSQ